MKLAEALAERADVQTRLQELQQRLASTALVQEGDAAPEDPAQLLAESERLHERLERLVRAINRTNAATAFDERRTITDAIAARDAAARRHRFLNAIAEAASPSVDRYSRSEIRYVPTVSVAQLRAQADEAARSFRELDTRLQGLNWTSELLEE
ncbi:MAG: DIP1984 family protein [Pseudoclavibacter sp.]|nr:DIP1984 family protein [Pseudoclavibacter sp.]